MLTSAGDKKINVIKKLDITELGLKEAFSWWAPKEVKSGVNKEAEEIKAKLEAMAQK